jgi:hypothetical protein
LRRNEDRNNRSRKGRHCLGYVLRGNGVDVAAIADRLPSALETARGFLGADMVYTADVMEVVEAATS